MSLHPKVGSVTKRPGNNWKFSRGVATAPSFATACLLRHDVSRGQKVARFLLPVVLRDIVRVNQEKLVQWRHGASVFSGWFITLELSSSFC